MTWRGTDDLWGYLQDALLPELKYGQDVPGLPPPGHKSHRNTLSTRFRKYRHLTNIHYLGVSFDETVNDCKPHISSVLPFLYLPFSQGLQSMFQTGLLVCWMKTTRQGKF